MKRALALSSLLLLVGAFGAAAGPTGRTVEKAYEFLEVRGPYPSGHIRHSSGVTFRTRPSESAVMVTIDDATGTRVPARISQDLDGDDRSDTEVEFCGATEKPVAITPGIPIEVRMTFGSCDGLPGGSLGGWTTGTMTATFSR